MSRKPKFRPIITRVKLNPEQAVLACGCYSGGRLGTKGPSAGSGFCVADTRDEKAADSGSTAASAS